MNELPSVLPMPSYNDPALAWALWYLSLGLLPLPIRSADEVDEYMRRAEQEHPEWTDKQFADARESAAKRPCIAWRGGMWAKRGIMEADVRGWFGAHPDRRIYLLTGVGSGLTDVDVDTYKGGDPAPWVALAGVVVTTPQGGKHCWFLEHEDARTNSQKIAEGVDVRGRGGGCVAPSGRSTPGRRFDAWEWPLRPCPEAALRPARKVSPTTGTAPPPGPDAAPRLLLHATGATGFSHVVSTERPDGTKTEAAKTIVGMLCRAAPLPDDAVAAGLGLLDAWLGTWPGIVTVRAGWEHVLRSAEPRSEEFTVEFVALWNAIRCRPPWPDDGEKSARWIAASLWRTATAAEQESRAAAAPPARLVLPEAPSGPVLGVAPGDGSESPQLSADDASGVAPNDVETSWLSHYTVLACDAYTAADVDADLSRDTITCARLPSWLGQDGLVDETTPYGHGWGDWMDDAVGGGLSPGLLWILVACSAKGGKTAYIDQHLTGMQMLGALSMARGWGPIPLVLVVTEMPKKGFEIRNIARYIGFDQGMFRRGKRAELAPGIREVAAREHIAPSEVVRRFADRTRQKLDPACKDLWALSRRLRRTIVVDTLEEKMQTGPSLIVATGDIFDVWRTKFTREHRIDPARIVPYVFFDPVQRFCDSQRGPDDSLPGDKFIKALRTATDNQQWITVVTSDTNQASARAGKIDTSKPPSAIVAQACRGTYTYLHVADFVCALDVLPLADDARRLQVSERRDLEHTARIFMGMNRWGAPVSRPLPFRYFPRTGRFIATDPSPPPPLQPAPTPHPQSTDPTAHQDPPPVVAAVAPPRLSLGAPRRGANKVP